MKYIVIFFYSLFSISHTVMAQEIVSINIFINDSANAFIDKVKILDGSYCKMLNRQPGKKNYLEYSATAKKGNYALNINSLFDNTDTIYINIKSDTDIYLNKINLKTASYNYSAEKILLNNLKNIDSVFFLYRSLSFSGYINFDKLKIFKEGTDFYLYKYEGIVGSYTDSEPIMQRHCREKQIDSTLLSLQDQFNMIKNSIKIKSINTFRKLDILYNNQLYHIEDGLKINNDFIKFIDNCGPD